MPACACSTDRRKAYAMITSEVEYVGELRTVAVHCLSGDRIRTDAPRDNHGKGEAFSPTDLVATALGSCMLSIMGIVARRDGMTSVDGCTAKVTKIMVADPRRIAEIQVEITMPANSYSDKERKLYEHTAHACPVAKSIHPDIRQVITFHWP
jgi:putative redox protein